MNQRSIRFTKDWNADIEIYYYGKKLSLSKHGKFTLPEKTTTKDMVYLYLWVTLIFDSEEAKYFYGKFNL